MFQFGWIQQSGIDNVIEEENVIVKVPYKRSEVVGGEAELGEEQGPFRYSQSCRHKETNEVSIA